jgi:hypothetical protein
MAAVIHFVVSGIWFTSPLGKIWAQALDADKKRKWMKPENLPRGLLTSICCGFLQCYVLAHVLAFCAAKGVIEGMVGAGWMFIGFLFATRFNEAMWQDQPWLLVVMDLGGHLACMLASGAFLASWPAY